MIACPFPAGSPVAIYARHSPGEDQTIDSQLAIDRAWCADNKLVTEREFIDIAKSGTSTAGREHFLEMVDLIESGQLRVVAVIVWNTDRLGRNADDMAYYRSILRRAGCDVFSITQELPRDRLGRRIVEAVHDAHAEQVSLDISINAKRGLRYIAQLGYWHGAKPPHGYTLGPAENIGMRKNGTPHLARKLVFDEKYQHAVARAWQMKLDGATAGQIHRETQVYATLNCYTTMFRNLTYTGAIKCGELVVPEAHPAYVNLTDFERIQARRRQSRGNPIAPDGDPFHSKRVNSPLILSGLLFCGRCGHAMVAHWVRGYAYYKCGRKARKGQCDQRVVAAWYVEETLCHWLADNVITSDKIIALRDDINRELNRGHAELVERKARYQIDLRELDKESRNLVNTIARLGALPEIESALKERTARARQVQRDIDEIDRRLSMRRIEATDEQMAYLVAEIKNILVAGEPEDVRSVLRESIARASIGEQDIMLDYIPPLAFVNNSVPPWRQGLIHKLPLEHVERALIPLPRAPLGRAHSIA